MAGIRLTGQRSVLSMKRQNRNGLAFMMRKETLFIYSVIQ